MARGSRKLTARTVGSLSKPGRYGDGEGLWLQISANGGKSWLLRYMLDGKARHMGLGPEGLITLAEARDRARAARKQLLDGIDPLERKTAERAAKRVAEAHGETFERCAERYIKAHEAAWVNPKHRAQWRSTLSTYCYPTIGALPVATIDTGLILKCLEPIWTEKPETAGRVRGRLESILDWATVRGYRAGDNPARWRGHLAKLLPAGKKVKRVAHYAALPYGEIAVFLTALRDREAVAARALEFLILTAARTGEVIGATWPEIDLGNRLWTVPAERMKAKKEHRVPLSDRVVELLSALPREDGNDVVFMGGRAGKPMSNMAMLTLLERMNRADLTSHGFRSSFRDWAAERTNYPNEVVEMALAHAVGNKVEAAYRRGDMFERRRRLMDDWAAFCGGAGKADGNVVMPGSQTTPAGNESPTHSGA